MELGYSYFRTALLFFYDVQRGVQGWTTSSAYVFGHQVNY